MAFYENDTVTTLIVSDGVTKIGNSAFSSCTNLIDVTISGSVMSIGTYAFAYCDNLTSITLENTEGWYYTSKADAVSGSPIYASNLKDPRTSAKYFSKDYRSYYLKRSDTL